MSTGLRLRHRLRFLVLALTFVCLSSIYSNQIIINFTFICMTKDVNDTITLADGMVRQRYDYSPQEKSWILMAFATGTIVSTIPINYLASKIGARIMFTTFGLLSAVATALSPWAAAQGLAVLLVIRLIQGTSFAANYVTIGMVVVDWSPLRETSTFIGILTFYNVASGIVTNPLSAAFCQTIGWQWSFYTHAAAGTVLFLLWCALYTDQPARSPLVSEKELRVIHKRKTEAHIEKTDTNVPYRQICTNAGILVIWFIIFVEITAAALLHSYTPIYFNKVLEFDVKTTGILSSVIAAVQIACRVGFSVASDRFDFASERTKMICFNFMAFVFSGSCLFSLGLSPWRALSITLFTLVFVGISANCGSVYKMATHVARQHAHFVISMMQFSKSLALFVGPGIVSLLVSEDNDREGWNHVFFFNGSILILSHFLFWRVCTDVPAAFTQYGTSEVNGKQAKIGIADNGFPPPAFDITPSVSQPFSNPHQIREKSSDRT